MANTRYFAAQQAFYQGLQSIGLINGNVVPVDCIDEKMGLASQDNYYDVKIYEQNITSLTNPQEYQEITDLSVIQKIFRDPKVKAQIRLNASKIIGRGTPLSRSISSIAVPTAYDVPWDAPPVIQPIPEQKIEINEEIFSKLIITDEIKKDIVSVLKQFNNRKKLFDEWGLGEVIEYGKGMTFLFYGPPGTGKTYAAKLMAKAIGKDLKTLDAAELESSEPGQFERNLEEAFEAATKSNQVIFIDECDGLIQSRKGMGQIMSGQNNKLLKMIEEFEGVFIMATNRIDSLDEALERRLSLILEFPRPTQALRQKIWENHLPKKMPTHEIDIKTLALFDLSGGQIKNAVLNAARFAIGEDAEKVTQIHFLQAIERVLKGNKAFSTPRNGGHQQMQSGKVKSI